MYCILLDQHYPIIYNLRWQLRILFYQQWEALLLNILHILLDLRCLNINSLLLKWRISSYLLSKYIQSHKLYIVDFEDRFKKIGKSSILLLNKLLLKIGWWSSASIKSKLTKNFCNSFVFPTLLKKLLLNFISTVLI